MDTKPTMCTPNEAATVMRVDPATIRNLCKRGKIPYKKAGRSYRIPIQWLEDWKQCDGLRT